MNSKILHAANKFRIILSKSLIVLIFIFAIFSMPRIASDGAVETTMDWVGYFLVIICVLGRIYCSVFIAGRKTLELVSSGPFSLVRNPLYVFSFLGMIGIALQFSMITIPILLAIVFCIYYPCVVAVEEQRLQEMFGAAYTQYKATVPRWIPRNFKMAMPTNIETNPKIILKSIGDASLFFLSLPAFELLETLHQHVIPTFWNVF